MVIVKVFSMRTFRYMILLILVSIISACGTPREQLTLVADHEQASTQVADIRTTATVVRARMQITLDHALTRVVEVEQQGLFMRSTLVALGTESAFISSNLPLPGSFPTFTPQPTSPINAVVTPASLVTTAPQLNAEGTPLQITPTPDRNSQPRLENIVLASGVNDSDCAIDTNPRFTTNSVEIYVVATAYNIPAGATIASIWQSNGTEVAQFSFQPEQTINGNCIWFFIDQSDAIFVPGTWSVELQINGNSASLPLPFQISDS